jgi:hypothetical protein
MKSFFFSFFSIIEEYAVRAPFTKGLGKKVNKKKKKEMGESVSLALWAFWRGVENLFLRDA